MVSLGHKYSSQKQARALILLGLLGLGVIGCTASGGPRPPAELSVTQPNNGTVTSDPAGIDCDSDCSEVFAGGTVVTLTAKADEGFAFAGWSGDCSGSGSCRPTMNANRSVTANFRRETESFTDQFGTSGFDFVWSMSVESGAVYVVGETTGSLGGTSSVALSNFSKVPHAAYHHATWSQSHD